jgi:hypothetical protein
MKGSKMAVLKTTKTDPAGIESADPLKTLWSLVNDAGERVAYVASTEKTVTSPSTGKSRVVTYWGVAVHPDEFRSGIQFIYRSRREAHGQLGRYITL